MQPVIRPPRGSFGVPDDCSSARMAGFSLIEMLTTMSVLAIMLVIASPGLVSLTSANALSSAQSELASAIMLARGEALKRAAQVGVAAASPASGAEFSGGWVIFVDGNSNGAYDVGEAVVREQPGLPSSVRVATSTGATAVAFNGRGFLSPFGAVTFTLCSTHASKSYQLRLEPVGLADVAETTGCL